MSEGIGDVKGSVGSFSDSGGFNSVVNELSSLIGCPEKGVKINIETGASSDCSQSSPSVSSILKRIDTLR